jgi:hypothetical protein
MAKKLVRCDSTGRQRACVACIHCVAVRQRIAECDKFGTTDEAGPWCPDFIRETANSWDEIIVCLKKRIA